MRTGAMTKLAIAAAVLVVAATIMTAGLPSAGDSESGPLLPDLKSQLNSLHSVTVQQAQETVTIEQSDDNWVVVEKDNYPADATKLRNALLDLADARRLEAKTSNPERHDQLGLANDDNSTTISLKGTSSETFTPVSVVLGKPVQADYRYVRMSDDNQAWLIDRNPDIPATASNWLAGSIIDIRSSDVKTVRIEHADGEQLSFSRIDGMLTPDSLPDGRELISPSAANSIANAMQNLQLDDVRAMPPDSTTVTTTTLTSNSGLTVTVRRHVLDKKDWFSFDASVVEPAADEDKIENPDSDDQTQVISVANEEQNAQDDQTSVSALATGINDRVQGWLYHLPSYKSEALSKRWQDLLKSEDDQ